MTGSAAVTFSRVNDLGKPGSCRRPRTSSVSPSCRLLLEPQPRDSNHGPPNVPFPALLHSSCRRQVLGADRDFRIYILFRVRSRVGNSGTARHVPATHKILRTHPDFSITNSHHSFIPLCGFFINNFMSPFAITALSPS